MSRDKSIGSTIYSPYSVAGEPRHHPQNNRIRKYQIFLKIIPGKVICLFNKPASNLSVVGMAIFMLLTAAGVSEERVQENNLSCMVLLVGCLISFLDWWGGSGRVRRSSFLRGRFGKGVGVRHCLSWLRRLWQRSFSHCTILPTKRNVQNIPYINQILILNLRSHRQQTRKHNSQFLLRNNYQSITRHCFDCTNHSSRTSRCWFCKRSCGRCNAFWVRHCYDRARVYQAWVGYLRVGEDELVEAAMLARLSPTRTVWFDTMLQFVSIVAVIFPAINWWDDCSCREENELKMQCRKVTIGTWMSVGVEMKKWVLKWQHNSKARACHHLLQETESRRGEMTHWSRLRLDPKISDRRIVPFVRTSDVYLSFIRETCSTLSNLPISLNDV